MENNLQDKARFFALYYGQPVGFSIHPATSDFEWKVGVTILIDDIDYISLKPISEISDEDAIEVAYMFDLDLADPESTELDRSNNAVTFLDNNQNRVIIYFDGEIIVEEGVIQQPKAILKAFDFLRSRGYLLPFMQYSTDQLIEMGWAKLNTNGN